jgi:hypothetical protein
MSELTSIAMVFAEKRLYWMMPMKWPTPTALASDSVRQAVFPDVVRIDKSIRQRLLAKIVADVSDVEVDTSPISMPD